MKVKFCGLVHPEDVAHMNCSHPDYVGLVFYDKSKRNLDSEQAARLKELLDPSIKTVGVFVDADISFIADMYERGVFEVVQLHGSESEGYIEELRGALEGVEVWKSFEISEAASGSEVAEVLDRANASSADLILLDAGKGQGRAFDWSLLDNVNRPFILAGGLSSSKVSRLMKDMDGHNWAKNLYAFDVSSGIEETCKKGQSPHKDLFKMNEFMNAVKTTVKR